jgi:hypothetical protein
MALGWKFGSILDLGAKSKVKRVPTPFGAQCTMVGSWPICDESFAEGDVRNRSVSSTDQCNTACSLSAGVSKPKVFRGR